MAKLSWGWWIGCAVWIGCAAWIGYAGAMQAAAQEHPVNTWVLQSPRDDQPAPNFPYEGSGAYDPLGKLWIHHAGHDGIPQSFHTFTFDLGSGRWQQLFPPTSPPGVCCVDGTNAFDTVNRRFVRFPGGSLGHGYQWSRGVKLKESAVWLYDPASGEWTNMRPPPYGEGEKYSKRTVGGLDSGATYDRRRGLVYTFGGQSSGGGKNSLFVYDVYANELTFLDAANKPPERDGMGVAYDTAHERLVMFGSQYLEDERTWLYDPAKNAWESHLLQPHPPHQKVTKDYCTIPRLCYDPLHGVVLCLAWLGEGGHETWALNVGKLQWTKLSPATEPAGSKSRSRNLDFDVARNLFILESSSSKTNRPEIWTYRYAPVDPAAGAAAIAPPADLQVVTEAGGRAKLTWQASDTSGVSEYRVYRRTADQQWRAEIPPVGTTAKTEYVDAGLKPGSVYFYTVTAVKAGAESPASDRTRTQPRVLLEPIVSVLSEKEVEVAWQKHPAEDVVGYNVYRGIASVRTVKKGSPGAWKDNDPEYAEQEVVQVRDVVKLQKLNEQPLTATSLADRVDLAQRLPESEDYRFAVYAYIVRAVNRLGVESGPSPYTLTIPSEPRNVLCREDGKFAELKWDAARERGVAGYHVFRLKGTWEIVRLTEQPIAATTYRHEAGNDKTRYWIVAVDRLGQLGQPSTPAWFNQSHRGFFGGEWHQ